MGVARNIVQGVKKMEAKAREEARRAELEEIEEYTHEEEVSLVQAEKDLSKMNKVIEAIAKDKKMRFGSYKSDGFLDKEKCAWQIRPFPIDIRGNGRYAEIEKGFGNEFLPDEKLAVGDVYFSKDFCILSIKSSKLGQTDITLGRDGNIYSVSFDREDYDIFDVTDSEFRRNASEKLEVIEDSPTLFTNIMAGSMCVDIIDDAYISLGKQGEMDHFNLRRAKEDAAEKYTKMYINNKTFREEYDYAKECNKEYSNRDYVGYNGYDSNKFLNPYIDDRGNFVRNLPKFTKEKVVEEEEEIIIIDDDNLVNLEDYGVEPYYDRKGKNNSKQNEGPQLITDGWDRER